jgi:hypothetical protein
MIRQQIILVIISFLLGCKSPDNPKKDFLQWAEKGKIINKVICKDDQTLSYCLYLPSDYNPEKNSPVLFCFDPHGDGTLPVLLFKDAGEKYGYIIIGSNNCKNGLQSETIKHIIDVLLLDTKTKIAVDPRRIYLAGFSGGARIASFVALNYGIAKGLIACSAGFDPSQGYGTFDIISIAGSEDMNYLEMRQMESALNNWPGKHQLFIFPGKHGWPPKTILEQSVVSFELFAMRDKLVARNDTIVNNFISTADYEINRLIRYHNFDSLACAYRLLHNTIYIAEGLNDMTTIQDEKKNLEQNKDLMNYIESEKSIEITEAQKQDEYSKAYTTRGLNWWTAEISKLNTRANKASKSSEKQSAKRLLAYVSLMSFSYVNTALNQQNWEAASVFVQIYGMADPENPDCHYFTACLYANTGKEQKAIDELKKSIALGFGDRNKLENDPLLGKLREQRGFEKLLLNK